MRRLAIILGTAAAVGFAAAASANPASSRRHSRVVLVPNRASSMNASEKGSATNRNSGAASRSSETGSAMTGKSEKAGASVRSEGTRRTSVRARSETTGVAVHGGSRRVIGARGVERDTILLKRRRRTAMSTTSRPRR